MEDLICGASAFRLYRVPPAILALYPPLPNLAGDRHRRMLRCHPLVEEVLGDPVHLLVEKRSCFTGADHIDQHLMTRSLPLGSSIDIEELELSVTSPIATLFTIARSVSLPHLIMAMYEFCGSFTLYRPSSSAEKAWSELERVGSLAQLGGWRRVTSASGAPSDLWMRPPLLQINELEDFAQSVHGMRYAKRFEDALSLVAGITASPFETQAAMLLTLPRILGGEGFTGFECNYHLRLTKAAQRIANKEYVVIDLFHEGDEEGHPPLAIECQGKLVHDGVDPGISDANRMAALQTMGIDVLPLSYRQIADPINFDLVVKLIAKKTGSRLLQKSKRLIDKQDKLRREIFIDWLTLGA